MKLREGAITSSPGPTPRASNARCSAVVQLLQATAYCAPTYPATSRSNSATRGPWVSQPLSITTRTLSSSSAPITGLVIGIIVEDSLPQPPSYLSPPRNRRAGGLKRPVCATRPACAGLLPSRPGRESLIFFPPWLCRPGDEE